jgi:hypothetical protein
MKKLSIAIVFMAAGFTFANAQTTETKEAAKQNVKVETVQQEEIQTADSAILMAPQDEVKVVEAEKSEATKEKSDQQNARKEKKELKKAETIKIE